MELPEGYIDARERHNVLPANKERKVDKLVSDKVGKTIYVNDPIVLKTVIGWKKASNKSETDTAPDNFLDDEKKVAELKEALK